MSTDFAPRSITPVAADMLRVVRKARFSRGLACPHCHDTRIARHGSFSGRQRYRCGSCRRTFSDLTGTLFAYTKRLGNWPRFLESYRRTETLRAAAVRADVNLSTSFRWRHRCMTHATGQSQPLQGWIEIVDFRVRHSEKGNHNPGFPGPRSGPRPDGPGDKRDHMAVMMITRDNNIAIATVGRVPARTEEVARVLGAACATDGVVIHRFGPLHAVGGAALLLRCQQLVIERQAFNRPDVLINDIEGRHVIAELQGWMERFRGVASKYLPRYFAYFRTISPQIRTGWLRAYLVQETGPHRFSRHISCEHEVRREDGHVDAARVRNNARWPDGPGPSG